MAMLEVKDLEVYYGMIQAIKGISFEVNQGEVIALIGANGAGKTTTLHTITGLLSPKKGSVMFEGTVFFAAHLMVITFFLRSKLWPFKQAENPDVRTTDDHFLMEVGVHGNEEELVSFFTNTGAVEVKVVEKH